MIADPETRHVLVTILVALAETQGALVRLMGNVQDLQLGSKEPEIPFVEVIEEWERASESLQKAAKLVFPEGGMPAVLKEATGDE